ncbi:hypothetical protein [Nonomuraea fuscirosea]|nr:hypothetical protein [Nonomuraea fuscirosea]
MSRPRITLVDTTPAATGRAMPVRRAAIPVTARRQHHPKGDR